MLADVAAATSSVHINQFGFRPGTIGESFAEALLAKAGEGGGGGVGGGAPGRAPAGGRGGASAPEGGSRELDERLAAGGIEVCVVRATKPRATVGPLGGGGDSRWNLSTLGHIDHRKLVVVDGRTGWVGGAG